MPIDDNLIEKYIDAGYRVSLEREAEIKQPFERYGDDSKIVYFYNGCILAPGEISMEQLAEDPARYIERGVLELCKRLWDLGICTHWSDGHRGKPGRVIISEENLSEENKNIFNQLARAKTKVLNATFSKRCGFNGGLSGSASNSSYFYVMEETEAEYSALSPKMADYFVPQDIKGEGSYTPRNFGTVTSLSREENEKTREKFKKFISDNKLEEFYCKDEEVVFASKFYYDKHQKYLEYLASPKKIGIENPEPGLGV